MSNLGDLMNDINGKNYATLAELGDVLGTVADSSSTASVIIGLIDLFVSKGDDTKAKLEEILKTIQQDYALLHEEQKAENILARLRDLDSGIIQAEGALAQLKAAATAQPPVSNEYRLKLIKDCLDGLIFMGLDDKWKAVYADQVYFSDPMWNDTKPASESEGLVFSHTYVQPYYLRVLFLFLVVAAALDPNFAGNYADSLRNAAQVLTDKHDKITNEGITNLSLAQPDRSYYHWSAAVERFSGCNAVTYHPAEGGSPWLRDLRVRKQIYLNVGLAAVYDAINRLKGLVGDPALPGGYGHWSMRELTQQFSQSVEGPNFNVRRLANYLLSTIVTSPPPPSSDPPAPISLRTVLAGV